MNDRWLDGLAPAHAPPPPSWWPPAPGWWVLLALATAAIAAALVWWRHPRLRLRRAALAELRRIRGRDDGDAVAVARALQNLLRRYALAVYGTERVARLHGDAWLRFLADDGAEALRGAPGQSLLRATFAGVLAEERRADPPVWLRSAEAFVRAARRRPVQGESA